MDKEALVKDVQPHEILVCIGLLAARMLALHSRRFTDHWAVTSTNAVPADTFG